MIRLTRRFIHFGKKRPIFWILAWASWFITLWILSSGNPAPEKTPDIPHLDKIVHFGYFFGGAGLFCAWLTHHFQNLSSRTCVLISTLMGAIVGIIDEYHQSFTPGRSGNDLGDWIADTSGALVGAITMLWVIKLTSTPKKSAHTSN
ncbi:VanZ family protein [Rubritalea tangerina]|uniref:VanZ family protein n=1 Tax=Rubritalea tangerina TaxID=430798 RepID=A0ABW4Z5S7_9BACT